MRSGASVERLWTDDFIDRKPKNMVNLENKFIAKWAKELINFNNHRGHPQVQLG